SLVRRSYASWVSQAPLGWLLMGSLLSSSVVRIGKRSPYTRITGHMSSCAPCAGDDQSASSRFRNTLHRAERFPGDPRHVYAHRVITAASSPCGAADDLCRD